MFCRPRIPGRVARVVRSRSLRENTRAVHTTGSPDDISVTLNTYYSWDFGQDVINGLTHELSEGGMGRIGGFGGAATGHWGTMDLFRYNAAGDPDYSDGRDGETTYFSYDGGATLSNQNSPARARPPFRTTTSTILPAQR